MALEVDELLCHRSMVCVTPEVPSTPEKSQKVILSARKSAKPQIDKTAAPLQAQATRAHHHVLNLRRTWH